MSTKNYDFRFCLIGGSAAGKSTFAEFARDHTFNPNRDRSIALNCINIKYEYNNKTYKIQIWDTVGEKGLMAGKLPFLRDQLCALLFFNPVLSCENAKKSMDELPEWYEIASDNGYRTVFVSTHKDMWEDGKCPYNKEKLMKRFKLDDIYDISSKTGEGVDNLLDALCEMAESGGFDLNAVNLNNENNTTGNCCN